MKRAKMISYALAQETRRAVAAHATLEAANDAVPKALDGRRSGPTYTFNAIQYALAMKVAADVARLFDVTNDPRFPVEGQDKASFLVLAALLARPDVRGELRDATLNPVAPMFSKRDRAACGRAISRFRQMVGAVTTAGTVENGAFDRIRAFRTLRGAHYLFDRQLPAQPVFDDLAILMDVATKAVKLANLAVEQTGVYPGEWIAHDREEALLFCQYLIAGVELEARDGPAALPRLALETWPRRAARAARRANRARP